MILCIGSVSYAQDIDTIAAFITSETTAEEPEFTRFRTLATEFDMMDTFADSSAELTVFLPTDAAFEDLLKEFNLTFDDLLEAPAILTDVLLYHVTEGLVFSDDLLTVQSLPTIQGSEIEIGMDDDNKVILDDIARIIESDIEASNGIIHVIDLVLLPGDAGEPPNNEPCRIVTPEVNTVVVRVGPGFNRTVVSFLPDNLEFEPLGRTEDREGNSWFQLDKATAAPDRIINEAWISADDVEIMGNCDRVGESDAPPVIPIESQLTPTPLTSNSDSETLNVTATNPQMGAENSTKSLPASGSWLWIFNDFTNASCKNVPNQVLPSQNVYGNLAYTVSVERLEETFTFDNVVMTDIGDDTYRGQVRVESLTGVIFIRVQSAAIMTGTFNITVDGCSAGTEFTVTRN
jgi:uncharacterized surface protein with fasciclin (FAS1) repeats